MRLAAGIPRSPFILGAKLPLLISITTEQRRPRRCLPLWASRSSSDGGARLCGDCTTRPEAFEATLGLGGWAGPAPCNCRARKLRARPGRPSGDSHSRHQLQRGAPRLWSPNSSRPAAPGRARISPRWRSASSRPGEGAVLPRSCAGASPPSGHVLQRSATRPRLPPESGKRPPCSRTGSSDRKELGALASAAALNYR
ncbi:uncharacterized protein LOC116550830 [Sapajus apella]|uniref:Uncharacterized protein LOC116550830 n=1 Tax=Sapajus apella TaxID=9515 RepID=A0A6J3HRS4_SAPAP|nr:uncharacterized protein LOC116550830 [Sapajus apella]